jgi:hypothetical protein
MHVYGTFYNNTIIIKIILKIFSHFKFDSLQKWVTSLQQGISTAWHETLSPTEEKHESSLIWEESDSEENSISAENGSSQKKQKTPAKPSAKQILLIPGKKICNDSLLLFHLRNSPKNSFIQRDSKAYKMFSFS